MPTFRSVLGALGATVVLSLVLVALAGVTPALAKHTVLCNKNEEVCAKGNTYGAIGVGTELTGYVGGEGTYVELELPKVATLSCSTAKLGTVLEQHEEGPMTGEGNRWPFFAPCGPESCSIGTSPAEAPVGYPSELEAVGGGDGVLRVSNPILVARCNKFPLVFECKYTTTTMQFSVEGGGEKAGEHGYIATSAPLTWKSGLNCGASATFRSRYEIYEPGSSLYVTN